ncbi:hypothetical protein BDV59DRAFT_192965 [Aspergillus ambiguus]|uniref:putative phosphatidate cytidylyltransferase n=1 Tax=Aspergillus ambiguus TaxID=176160 RepID=UPI003CCE1DD5
MSSSLNVIALVSGGKDSLYSILHCLRNGHNVVALANLHPPSPTPTPASGHDHDGDDDQEETDLDSFMYQTIGHSVIPLYERALNLPLYRAPITGAAVDTARIYRDTADPADAPDDTDETEALVPLLRRVLHDHPHANAVSAGAILSTYQRTRIENVAARLGLVPLAWLWQYPVLPREDGPSGDAGLLEDMAAVGCDARIIKVASGGLDESFLWGDVGRLRTRLVKAMRRFAAPEDLRGAVLGEGGEYESLALDGPAFLWKRRVVVDRPAVRSAEGGVAFVALGGARCEEKEAGDGQPEVTPADVRRPALLDGRFARARDALVEALDAESSEDRAAEEASGQVRGPRGWGCAALAQARNRETWTVANVTAAEAGPGAAEQMVAIASKIRGILGGASSTTADIVFATVLLRSMADFPAMNAAYVSMFKKPNPPARATVACGDGLPDGVNVMVSLVVDLGPRERRHGLHVQSRSYWAPANIGPYSQAVAVPLPSAERCVYVAGQIPLDPASMELVDGSSRVEERFSLRAVLSLQHMWRIGTAMQVDWWLAGVAYFTGPQHQAHVAWWLWEMLHAPASTEDADEEGPVLDAWDIKYGGRAHEAGTAGTGTAALPNFDIAEADEVIVPPFFAVQVAELPRGSDVEWQGLGYGGGGVKLTMEVIEEGQVIHTTTEGGLRYTAVELDLERSASDLESSLQRVLERYAPSPEECHCVLYSAQPVSGDAWCGQIVPCQSVWGQVGRRLAAGVVIQKRTPVDSDLSPPENLRQFARSPHPYHRRGVRAADLRLTENGNRSTPPHLQWPRTSSDSGTEADDESTGVLKGLPAPPLRPRKGLRSTWNGGVDTNDPWLPALHPWPSFARSASRSSRRSSSEDVEDAESVGKRRRIEVLRRLMETALLLSVGVVVLAPEHVRTRAWEWRTELLVYALVVLGTYISYPFIRNGRLRLSGLSSFVVPSTFDPAPLLYPILIPVYVALSLSNHHPSLVLPNIILGLSSLPVPAIPLHGWIHGHGIVHWMLALLPMVVSEHFTHQAILNPLALRGIPPEVLILVFPLHQALIPTLDFLLTTSVLPAELQLLTSALINLFLFASSPQAEILKALLWLGSLCIFLSCRYVLRWEVALARIPTWKFRRSPSSSHSRKSLLNMLDHKLCQRLSRAGSSDEPMSDSDSEGSLVPISRTRTHEPRGKPSSGEPGEADGEGPESESRSLHRRRHTISSLDDVRTERVRTTPSGRRKRSMAPGLASFLSLTVPQAQVRKWLYALYVYGSVLVIIMGPVRKYVGQRALHGAEPFGWALGYLFGNLSWFRFWTIMWNLEHWIPLPARWDSEWSHPSCALGWVEHLRQTTIGAANTRLLIAGHCVAVIVTGLAVVFQLSSITEVDTRRKVFHGMMVLMFLPTVYIDPAFCALALGLVLAIFLLLDLFRASQMPPISRPLTYFLAPYVDGRDHRGPVIVSHVFLLIGCSIPLWLSLADLPRSGERPWEGWSLLSRDVGMVSGIICVGMGDAAASLVGRRFGRLKWFWGGGKSLEGSVAFAVAVTGGLIASRAWLAVGQWPVAVEGGRGQIVWLGTVCKAVLAAGGTSATEAILTGCNDNVVVPVVLWLLVRGLGL